MKITTACGVLLAITIFLSCNEADKKSSLAENSQISGLVTTDRNTDHTNTAGDNEQVPVSTDSVAGHVHANQVNTNDPTPGIDWDKKIIKNATVKYEVKSFDQFNKEMRERVIKFGGYIAQENNYRHEDRKEVSLVIKVPVQQFEPMMNDISGKDARQVERTIKSEDVTGQVVDTRSRLEAKKEMRQKYLEFLRQSKNMEEVLKVQAEINSIQEEIEAAAGRIQYLNKSAAFSTINFSFYEPIEGFKAPVEDNSFWHKTGSAFSRGGEMVKGLMLAIISIWPLILAGLIGLLVWKRKRTISTAVTK